MALRPQWQLTLYSPSNVPLWSRKLHTHHMMTVTEDQNFLYTLGSEYDYVFGLEVRYDTVLKIDLATGKTVKRFSVRDNYPALRAVTTAPKLLWNTAPHPDGKTGHVEGSHANSVYIAPSGEIVVNVHLLGVILYLDPDLRRIIRVLNRKDKIAIHDVQPLTNGNLLMYVNESLLESASSLEEFDPVTEKVVWKFSEMPASRFYSKSKGGVQRFKEGHILYSDNTDYGKFILLDPKGKRIWMRPSAWIGRDTGRPCEIYSIKAQYLDGFLRNNPGI